ncbi:polysaccharide deacetylase family protein [Christiangramia sediminis]|uniref:Polysaccharide deacetylase family protein n=1 Tax=Christiangramia sediminis TaxID=2881336 RepID=A0A9X1RZ22_9FLAO|nr:polysaccharide deacetylase family protein [Christiangramia sediminis]MCB7482359.1 polysaccharide deacetylase family protein [Christiangramia sediminis]
MKLFRPKYPSLLKALYPGRISRVDTAKAIYLTFDDGPIPEVTPWVLDLLAKYNAKATFFCIGDNVQKHPDIFQQIQAEGHCIGNHTYNHLNGWETPTSEYIENVYLAESALKNKGKEETSNHELRNTKFKPPSPHYKLFRPPYGKIKNAQAKRLKSQGFKIVVWDVISGDYNGKFSAQDCLNNVTKNATAGSTIVFHDSKKAFKNLKVILPQILDFYKEKGLEFRSLKDVL